MADRDDDIAKAFAAPGIALSAHLRGIGGELARNREDSENTREWMASIGSELVSRRADLQANAEALAEIRSDIDDRRADAGRQWEVMAGINLSMTRVGDLLDSFNRRERAAANQRMADQPIYADFAFTNNYPAAGVLTVNCGGPSQGRIWHVKRLVVGGVSLATAAAGTAEAYATGWVPDVGNVASSPLSDLMDATILISSPQTNLPNIGNYDDGQFVVQGGEKLWVVIRSGTPAQAYVVAGTAKDMRVQPHDVDVVVG